MCPGRIRAVSKEGDILAESNGDDKVVLSITTPNGVAFAESETYRYTNSVGRKIGTGGFLNTLFPFDNEQKEENGVLAIRAKSDVIASRSQTYNHDGKSFTIIAECIKPVKRTR